MRAFFDKLFNRTKIVELEQTIKKLEAINLNRDVTNTELRSLLDKKQRDLDVLHREKSDFPGRFERMLIDVRTMEEIHPSGYLSNGVDVVLQLPSFAVNHWLPLSVGSERPEFVASNTAARLDAQMKHHIMEYIDKNLALEIEARILEIL